jgi:hypothetical protein
MRKLGEPLEAFPYRLSVISPTFIPTCSRAEQKQAALEAREAALAASGHEPVTGGQKKRKREREESVATGDGESVRPSGNRKKNRGGDDD